MHLFLSTDKLPSTFLILQNSAMTFFSPAAFSVKTSMGSLPGLFILYLPADNEGTLKLPSVSSLASTIKFYVLVVEEFSEPVVKELASMVSAINFLHISSDIFISLIFNVLSVPLIFILLLIELVETIPFPSKI